MKRYLELTLYLLAVLFFGQCSSEYHKGEKEFSLENYAEARTHFASVRQGSENYNEAQSRIIQIDSIRVKGTFDVAIRLFKDRMYSDAEALFFTIDSTNYLYGESSIFLKKIDSARQARNLENQRRASEEKIRDEKNAKLKVSEDARALREIKHKTRILLNELIAFKDKSDFHYYGFAVAYKYNR
jgi:hypothetical protein